MSVVVAGFCPSCRRDVTTDESHRCPACGTATLAMSRSKPRVVDGTASATPSEGAPAEPPAVRTITLPRTKQTVRLREQVQAALDELLAEQATLAAERDRIAASLQRCEQGVRTMRALLRQVEVEPPPEGVRAPSTSGRERPRSGRWSRDHDACVRCGRTDRRHNAGGLCRSCYQSEHRKEAAS